MPGYGKVSPLGLVQAGTASSQGGHRRLVVLCRLNLPKLHNRMVLSAIRQVLEIDLQQDMVTLQ